MADRRTTISIHFNKGEWKQVREVVSKLRLLIDEEEFSRRGREDMMPAVNTLLDAASSGGANELRGIDMAGIDMLMRCLTLISDERRETLSDLVEGKGERMGVSDRNTQIRRNHYVCSQAVQAFDVVGAARNDLLRMSAG